MQIVKWEWHQKQRLYAGEAVSTRGRRYAFGVKKTGRVYWIERQAADPHSDFWLRLGTRGPVALLGVIRRKVRRASAIRS
jgi:hypothetical protein